MRPCVTICVPAYQAEAFIGDTLESALGQSWQDLRVIVSVDHSRDGTAARARHYARDQRVAVMTQDRRVGWIRNTNRTLAAIETPLAMILPHDDVLHPEYVERCVRALQGDPEAVCAFSDIDTFGEQVMPVMQPGLAGGLLERVTSFLRDHFAAVGFRGIFDVRRIARRLVPPHVLGGFAADTVWVGRMACYGNLVRVADPLYRKRLHAASAHVRWKDASEPELDDMWAVHCAELAFELLRTRPFLARNSGFWHAVRDRLRRKGQAHFIRVGDNSGANGTREPLVEMLKTYARVRRRPTPYSWMKEEAADAR